MFTYRYKKVIRKEKDEEKSCNERPKNTHKGEYHYYLHLCPLHTRIVYANLNIQGKLYNVAWIQERG